MQCFIDFPIFFLLKNTRFNLFHVQVGKIFTASYHYNNIHLGGIKVNVGKVYSDGGAAVQPGVSNSWSLLYCCYCCYFITVSQDVNRRQVLEISSKTYIYYQYDIIAFYAPTTAIQTRGGAYYYTCRYRLKSGIWSMRVLSAVVLRTRVVQKIRWYYGDNVTMEICTYGVFVYIIISAVQYINISIYSTVVQTA